MKWLKKVILKLYYRCMPVWKMKRCAHCLYQPFNTPPCVSRWVSVGRNQRKCFALKDGRV